MPEDTKKCPFCAEAAEVADVFCAYCGNRLDVSIASGLPKLQRPGEASIEEDEKKTTSEENITLSRTLKRVALGVIIIAIGLFLFGRNYTLSCTRLETGQVNCTHSEWIIGIKMWEGKVDSLVGAEVASRHSRGDYGGTHYAVRLRTASGRNIILSSSRHASSWSSGRQYKERLAQEINSYLLNQEQKTMELNYAIQDVDWGLLTISLLIGIAIVYSAVKTGPWS